MTEKPMTQIIRELISANFPIEIIGQPRALSQFGVPYTLFHNGKATPETRMIESATPGEINTRAIEWISQQPHDHDVAVWRELPEQLETHLRWRLHTMPRAKLIEYLNAMTAVQDAALMGSYWPGAQVSA